MPCALATLSVHKHCLRIEKGPRARGFCATVCDSARVPWQHKGVLVWDAFLVRVYVSHWSVPLASAAEFVDTPKKRDFRIRRVCKRIYACERGERASARRSCWCSSMDSSAVAALAMVVNHEFAGTLRDLVHQIEELTRETQQLAQQALQYRRDVLSMRAVLAAALQDVGRNDLESVEELLRDCE